MLKKLKTWIFRKRIKAVIFDYDGVLNDSLSTIKDLYNEFCRRGMTNLYFKDDQEFTDFFQGDMWNNMEAAGMEITEENKSLCNKVVKGFLAITDPDVRFFDGADSLLLKLKSEGYKIGIASNGNKDIIIPKLRSYGLSHVVDSIVGFEQISNPKPDPEVLLKCLEELGVKPKNALFIGDMESDIQAANACGMKIIAVTYGYLKLKKDMREMLKNADMIADTVGEIYERIKNG